MTPHLRSEWIKARSSRVLLGLPPVAMLAGPSIAAFVGLTGSLQPDDTILGAAATGMQLTAALVGIWGALTITLEFGSGSIRPTVMATPRRVVVTVAKATLVTATGALVGFVAIVLAYPIGLATLDTSAYRGGDPFPAVFGVAAHHALFALLGFAFGMLVRSSAGAVAAVAAVAVVPTALAPVLGPAGPWIGGAAPSAVVVKLAQSSDAASLGSLGGWASLVVMAGYTMILVGCGSSMFERRDL